MEDIKGHIQCLIENVGLNAIKHKDQKQVIEEAEKVMKEIVKTCSIPDVVKPLQDKFCTVCNLPTDGEKCYSGRCPM